MSDSAPGTRAFAPFEWMLALRYLRARRKEGFVSVISGFSLVGIALGVATLIIVLSVMGGFRQEFLKNFLGFKGHVVVSGPSYDPDAVAAWLDGRLVRHDDDAMTRTWHELVDAPGGSSIRASVTVEADELTLFTMSEERFDALLDALLEARPEVEILEQQRRTADDLADSGSVSSRAGSRASSMIDPNDADPELAAALQDYIRGYEQRWLDESIPALGGVTPREAAADPTRRDDLVRLLDSFPADDGSPGQMSATRLRADLGLA